MSDRLPMACDRSVRSVDQDGHLHIQIANISKAAVNPYRGNEIPDYERLGLSPRKIYQLLRDPDELARAAPSFAGKPLLSLHKPITATDHEHKLTVGSVGQPIRYDHPYLRAPLTVWDAAAIAGIEQDIQRELSSAYRYDADMTPGEYEGVPYDGVMRNIRGNHVALVETGRAGSDVVVGDAALVLPPLKFLILEGKSMPLSRTALFASGALRAYVLPKLAVDQKIDFNPLLQPVTAKNWKQQKPRLVRAITKAAAGKLAADADIEDVARLLDSLDDVTDEVEQGEANLPPPVGELDPEEKPADDAGAPDEGGGSEDEVAKITQFLTGKLTPEDLATLMTMIKPQAAAEAPAAPPKAEDEADPDLPTPTDKDPPMPPVTKAAMDAAISAAARVAAATAEKQTIAKMNAIREAERAVRPFVGEIAIAQDSAEAVYKLALDAAGLDVTDIPPTAYRAMLQFLPKPETRKSPAPVAMDSAQRSSFAERYPGAAAVRTL